MKSETTSKNISTTELDRQRRGDRRFQQILEDFHRPVYGIEFGNTKKKDEEKDK